MYSNYSVVSIFEIYNLTIVELCLMVHSSIQNHIIIVVMFMYNIPAWVLWLEPFYILEARAFVPRNLFIIFNFSLRANRWRYGRPVHKHGGTAVMNSNFTSPKLYSIRMRTRVRGVTFHLIHDTCIVRFP